MSWIREDCPGCSKRLKPSNLKRSARWRSPSWTGRLTRGSRGWRRSFTIIIGVKIRTSISKSSSIGRTTANSKSRRVWEPPRDRRGLRIINGKVKLNLRKRIFQIPIQRSSLSSSIRELIITILSCALSIFIQLFFFSFSKSANNFVYFTWFYLNLMWFWFAYRFFIDFILMLKIYFLVYMRSCRWIVNRNRFINCI